MLGDTTEAAIADALAAGHTDVVSPHPLITMLIALRMNEDKKGLANV